MRNSTTKNADSAFFVVFETEPLQTETGSQQTSTDETELNTRRNWSPIRRLNFRAGLESYHRTSGSSRRATLGSRSSVTYHQYSWQQAAIENTLLEKTGEVRIVQNWINC